MKSCDNLLNVWLFCVYAKFRKSPQGCSFIIVVESMKHPRGCLLLSLTKGQVTGSRFRALWWRGYHYYFFKLIMTYLDLWLRASTGNRKRPKRVRFDLICFRTKIKDTRVCLRLVHKNDPTRMRLTWLYRPTPQIIEGVWCLLSQPTQGGCLFCLPRNTNEAPKGASGFCLL